MSRRREAERKAIEWLERQAADDLSTADPIATEAVHHSGRPWVEDWQAEWAETTLDVVKKAWANSGARMYRSQGMLYDDLYSYLLVQAQELANQYKPRWSWESPERAWAAYLWTALQAQARWHFATTIGKRNKENVEVHSKMDSRDLRIEALMNRATPEGQHRLERALQPMLSWRPMSPERYVQLAETLREKIHQATTEGLPQQTDDECIEHCGRPASRTGRLCEQCYRKSLELWRDGPRCQRDGCPDAATKRQWCSKHYQSERERSIAAGTPWEKKTYPDTCSVEGCDRDHAANGYCNTHARAHQRAQAPTCTAPGCTSAQDSKGLCPYHWLKAKEASAPPCSVDGCNTGATLKAMCRKHYRAAARAEGRNA